MPLQVVHRVRGNFYFHAAAAQAVDVEQQAWEVARAANTRAAYQSYLREYPNGRLAAARGWRRRGKSASLRRVR